MILDNLWTTDTRLCPLCLSFCLMESTFYCSFNMGQPFVYCWDSVVRTKKMGSLITGCFIPISQREAFPHQPVCQSLPVAVAWWSLLIHSLLVVRFRQYVFGIGYVWTTEDDAASNWTSLLKKAKISENIVIFCYCPRGVATQSLRSVSAGTWS